MVESVEQKIFPFESFRNNQYDVLRVALDALWGEGYDNIVIDGPVGTGKSGINTALLNHAEDGFYTTPQKSLREQLENDEDLQDDLFALKARRDYFCSVGKTNCEDCDVYNSNEESCSDYSRQCAYWSTKLAAMNAQSALITFSYLIIDGLLPTYVGYGNDGEEMQISFDDRELVVVDEAQNLDVQARSLHANTSVSPFSVDPEMLSGLFSSIPYDAKSYSFIEDEMNTLKNRCAAVVADANPREMTKMEERCERMVGKISWIEKQREEYGNTFVIEVDSTYYGGEQFKTVDITPIKVDSFLQQFVWSRAKKRVISTATLLYRDNPDIWLRNIGLDPEKTKIISVGMPFAPENRPIYTSTMVGSMSGGGYERHKPEVLEALDEIAEMHHTERGIVHTASYDRAEDLVESIDENEHFYLHDNIIADTRERDTEVVIEDWLASDHDILASPNIVEGVDLKYDKGRFNVLLKVPFRSMDNLTSYMLENFGWAWNWYYERAMVRMVQAYGRTIRADDDWANTYVLDTDFNKVMKRRKAPSWFKEAIVEEEPEKRSIFDY